MSKLNPYKSDLFGGLYGSLSSAQMFSLNISKSTLNL